MTKSREEKLDDIPVINVIVRFFKKIKLPGFEGLSVYDLLELYAIGIVKGALTTRASAIAFSFFTAIFPFLLFVVTVMPHIPIKDFQTGDSRMGWANALSAFSGTAAMAGGVFLLIPGGQPVAAVLLSASVITGVASLAVEYWPTPTGATTPVDTSLRPPTPPISTPIQTETPTIPPTAVPTLTPTPPITSTPSPTPQVTQTPSPTQTQSGGN